MKTAEQNAQTRTKKPSLKQQLAEANAKLEMARELWRMIPRGQARKIVLAHRALSAANKAKAESMAAHDAKVAADQMHHERNIIVEAELDSKFVIEDRVEVGCRELQHNSEVA